MIESFALHTSTTHMTQPAGSKHWRTVVSHPDRPQSNHAHLTVLQYYNMHADIIQKNRKRNIYLTDAQRTVLRPVTRQLQQVNTYIRTSQSIAYRHSYNDRQCIHTLVLQTVLDGSVLWYTLDSLNVDIFTNEHATNLTDTHAGSKSLISSLQAAYVNNTWNVTRQRLYSANHVDSRWKIQDRRQIKNTDNTETKHNPDKANNTKHSKTKLPWFSRLLQHSARRRGGLILQCSQAYTEGLKWLGKSVTVLAELWHVTAIIRWSLKDRFT